MPPRRGIDPEHHRVDAVARRSGSFDGCLTRLLHDISET
jgi:hypothetical protein